MSPYKERVVQELKIKPVTIVEFADPRTAILSAADSWKANIIVLGTHGLTVQYPYLT